MKIKIVGLSWHACSPSLFILEHHASVVMWYNGWHWVLTFDGEDGPAAFVSRDQAARLVKDGIDAYTWEQMA